MKTLRLVAATALVSSVFALSASAAEKEWWNVDFTSPTTNGVNLVVGELGALTNNEATMAATQPYPSGYWTAIDSDESYVTNEFNPSGSFGGDNCLRLDTQGNDLTWTPKDPTNGVQTLVDADLYLVGSDSEPTDFDADNDVQAAIYLKNQTDDDTQETTNSVLCLYVWDDDAGESKWVDLTGYKTTPTNDLLDNAWYRIQVIVDHSGDKPKVSVKVNDTQMCDADNNTSWDAANNNTAKTAGMIKSVAFRGTGAVDNFVGKTVVEEEIFCTLTVETWVDSAQNGTAAAKNPTLIATGVPVGSPYTFSGLAIDDYEEGQEASYALSRIVIYNADGTVLETINYSDYDGENIDITPDKDDSAYFEWGLDGNDYRDGSFLLTVPTTGIADGDNLTIAKVYYTSFNPPQPSTPEVDVGEGLAAYAAAHPGEDVPAPVAFNETTELFEVSFVAPQTGRYVLLVSATVDGPYTEDAGSAVTVTTAGEPVTLTESTSSATAKFFKIGYGD